VELGWQACKVENPPDDAVCVVFDFVMNAFNIWRCELGVSKQKAAPPIAGGSTCTISKIMM
jgi:hypothetical protein